MKCNSDLDGVETCRSTLELQKLGTKPKHTKSSHGSPDRLMAFGGDLMRELS